MRIAMIGTGYVGLVAGTCFAENGNDVVCVDISNTAVKKLKAAGVNAVQADLREKWPFKDSSFEQILALDVFEHLGQVEFFLSELSRLSKKGGCVILGIPLLNYWKNYLKLLMQTTDAVQYDEHPRMFFDSDIRAMFAKAGFRLAEAKYLGITRGYGYYKFVK